MGTLMARALLALHQLRQAAAWPSLDQEPPLAAQPAEAPTASWRALEPLIATLSMGRDDELQGALDDEGPPPKRRGWRRVTDQVEALPSVMASSRIVSPERPIAEADNQRSLIPLVTLAEAQLLRGWDWYAGGNSTEAAEDMLPADRLGQQLLDGSQSLLMLAVGHATQTVALRELGELLTLAEAPTVEVLWGSVTSSFDARVLTLALSHAKGAGEARITLAP